MLEKIKKLLPHKLFKALQPIYHYIIAFLAALVYRFPSRKMIVIGVTGTAGKTSTVYLISKTLTAAGYKTGFTSTAVFSDGDKEVLNDKKMTMPGRFFIQRSLHRMIMNGWRYAIVETTSEGIKQFRHRFINYDILVFTGLYPEHIESHGNFDNYKKAKGKLFKHLKHCST
jgi:UDP-N-acetylmuramoyl-L-alanyl-D-glutamate--2,6-diaminopimelate ligase